MALHRDIHWIGRQWAVTGHGMQLIDQKLQGFFDIEASELWDENLIAGMHAKEWLNRADFEKGLAVARLRFPQTPHAATPPEAAPVVPAAPVAPFPPVAKPEAPKRETPKLEQPAPVEARATAASPEPVIPERATIEPPKPLPPRDFHMRFAVQAKFIRPWRVWMKRQT